MSGSTGIIEEIQKEALDPKASIATLLRKLKLAAAKLGLGQVETWVELELKGYKDSVPEYRQIRGQPEAWNPFRGWIPIGGSADVVRALSVRAVGQSIGSLESLLEGDGNLFFSYSPETIEALNKGAGFQLQRMGLSVSRSTVAGIIDAVRNQVLEWAIELEKAGINGEGVSFSREEQAIAKTPALSISIGSIGSFAGNLGADNVAGDITVRGVEVEQVRTLVANIRRHRASLAEEGVDLDNDVTELEAEAMKSAPDQRKLRSLLKAVRDIAVQGTGNLISAGILSAINAMLGTGVPSP